MQRIFGIIFLFLLIIPEMVSANVEIPATVFPGRLGERFAHIPTPREIVNIEIGDIIDAPVLKQADKTCFTLHRIQLLGNAGCCHHHLDHFYKRYLGKQIKIIKVQEIADAITRHYHSEGYLLPMVQELACAIQVSAPHTIDAIIQRWLGEKTHLLFLALL